MGTSNRFRQKDKCNIRTTQIVKSKTTGQRISRTVLGSLAKMAKKCDIAAGEEEWIRDIFINSMKNYDIKRKLLTETPPPREALNVALIEGKGTIKSHETHK